MYHKPSPAKTAPLKALMIQMGTREGHFTQIAAGKSDKPPTNSSCKDKILKKIKKINRGRKLQTANKSEMG